MRGFSSEEKVPVKPRSLGVILAVGLMATACGGEGNPGGDATNSPAASQPASSTPASSNPSLAVDQANLAMVDTSNHPCATQVGTRPGSCYLPLYTQATYSGSASVPINVAPGTKCTRDDESRCWPQPGTKVQLVCYATGEETQDGQGRKTKTWYAVAIPPSEVLNKQAGLPRTTQGTVVGVAPSTWFKRLSYQPLPSCDEVLKPI